MFLRDFVLAILIKISYRALFFRRCPLPCKIFFSIQIFLLGTGHLQKKRAQLKSSKYFCWALFFWRCPRALFFWRCPVKIFEYWKIIWEYKMMPMGIFQKMHRFFNQKRALYRKIIYWPYNINQKETRARGLFKPWALITQEDPKKSLGRWSLKIDLLSCQGWAKTQVFYQKPSPVGLTGLNWLLWVKLWKLKFPM